MTLHLGQSTKTHIAVPGEPGEFAMCFILHGWRGIERCFGARTDRLLKWIAMEGGPALYEARRRYQQTGVAALPQVLEMAA